MKEKKNCKECNSEFETNQPNHIFCKYDCRISWYEEHCWGSKWKYLRYQTLLRDNFKCNYCGRNPTEHNIVLNIDHLKPKDCGGKDIMDNLITSCEDCNNQKSNTLFTKKLLGEMIRRIKSHTPSYRINRDHP